MEGNENQQAKKCKWPSECYHYTFCSYEKFTVENKHSGYCISRKHNDIHTWGVLSKGRINDLTPTGVWRRILSSYCLCWDWPGYLGCLLSMRTQQCLPGFSPSLTLYRYTVTVYSGASSLYCQTDTSIHITAYIYATHYHTYRLFVEIMILLVAGLFHVCVPCSEEQDSESLNIMTMNIV